MNLTLIEDKLFVVSERLGLAVYDFDFDLHFECTHPYLIEGQRPCIMRVGAIANYAQEYEEKMEMGLQLINSPDQYVLASELEAWYPLVTELTPRTVVYEALPTVLEIESNFDWPVFLKGSRQTSKHNPDLAVIYKTVLTMKEQFSFIKTMQYCTGKNQSYASSFPSQK